MDATASPPRRRRRWKAVRCAPFVAGIVGMFAGLLLGYALVGSVIHLLGIVLGTASCGAAQLFADVTIYDERSDAIARSASHYTYLTAVYPGLAVFPLLFVLDAAGAFSFGPTATGLLYAFSPLGLTWGAYYTGLRRRS